jgi:quercetin dioxygenase-like cupin family protein
MTTTGDHVTTPPAAIVTQPQAQARRFLGIRFEVLATGPQSMVTKMLYEDGDDVAQHAHPNGQAGYIVSARVRLTVAGQEHELGPGDSYVIPADVLHSLTRGGRRRGRRRLHAAPRGLPMSGRLAFRTARGGSVPVNDSSRPNPMRSSPF